ncbi:MAG: hypothetical protein FJW66_06335 [Actinobacteria bacterium]|nr:hypothetical protein [Actinomycetota bacterium]
MDIQNYRQKSEIFLSELDKEYYLHYSGLKQDLNISDIYDRYAELFSFNNFKLVREFGERSSAGDFKRFSYLLRFCGEGLLENRAKKFVDLIGEQEARATVNIDGKDVPFRYSEIMLSNEASKAKRDLIDDRRNEKISAELNPAMLDYWNSLHDHAKTLGFCSYRNLIEFLKQEDFGKLASDMELLLKQTGSLYVEHFGRLFKTEMGFGLESSRKSDFAYFRRAEKYDRYFKKEILVQVFKDTLKEMGIDIDRQPNIILDVEDRKNKTPRAFCAVVRVPGEIYLVVMPRGGQDDFEAIFHEGGHAEHFAHTKPDLEFEYRLLGDNAITEGYAFSLEHLMQSMAWLVNFLKMAPDDAAEFVYFSNIIKLWFCRRYAAKLHYELILHDESPIAGRDEVYKTILESANLMQYNRADYLKDVDESFYCTSYIRAWIFEAQLKDYMHRKFGYDWFSKRKAGSFLKEIWSYGQKYSPDEILQQLDFKGLDISYLISSLIDGLKRKF